MAYNTGVATSISDLITAIANIAVLNGWSKTATNDILYKGNVFAQLSEVNLSYVKGLGVQLGTSQTADTLVNPTNHKVGLTTNLYSNGTALYFPCTYHIFINTLPDEIVVAVNYGSVHWQWLAFGQSTTIGISGTGIYCWGSACLNNSITTYNDYLSFRGVEASSTPTYYQVNPCFYACGAQTNYNHSFIRVDFDGVEWGGNIKLSNAYETNVQTYRTLGLLARQPNTWNSEAILVRTILVQTRASGFWSYVAELPHFRWLRNKYIDDGTVLSLGGDDWFVAPITSKSLISPNGWTGGTTNINSGTYAFAVRKVV